MAARLKTLCKISGITFGAFCTLQAVKQSADRNETIVFASEKRQNEHYQLVHAQIAFRHGARTPVFDLPEMHGSGKNVEPAVWDIEKLFGDLPHTLIKYTVRDLDGGMPPVSVIDAKQMKKVLKGGSPYGQLTKVGQQQMYNLGKELHRRYAEDVNLLNPVFSHHEVFVRSTNVKRTIDSARCVLAGMYGQDNIQGVVTMVTTDEKHETLYPNVFHCGTIARWVQNCRGFLKGAIDDYDKSVAMFREDLGFTKNKFYFVHFRDVIAAMEIHNLPVDPVLNKHRDVIEKYAVQEVASVQCGPTKGRRILQLSSGKFLEDILNRMKDKITGISPASHKMCLYSVHDTSLVCLLTALEVFDNKWPDFAADLAFELYTNENQKYFVKVLIQGKELILPGSTDAFCPYEKFNELVTPYLLDDWEAACKL